MSTSLKILIVLLLWAMIVAVGYLVLRGLRQRKDALLRFQRDTAPPEDSTRDGESFGWLRRQMILAGFFRPEAGFLLIVTSGLMLIVGGACALGFRWSGLQQQVLDGIELVPGGLSGILAPIAILSPWLITLLAASTPLLIVRASRRNRVNEVSRDLHLALDLWSTLSEGGMGFDAAQDRWQKTQRPGRLPNVPTRPDWWHATQSRLSPHGRQA